jgi:hypothetical protein
MVSAQYEPHNSTQYYWLDSNTVQWHVSVYQLNRLGSLIDEQVWDGQQQRFVSYFPLSLRNPSLAGTPCRKIKATAYDLHTNPALNYLPHYLDARQSHAYYDSLTKALAPAATVELTYNDRLQLVQKVTRKCPPRPGDSEVDSVVITWGTGADGGLRLTYDQFHEKHERHSQLQSIYLGNLNGRRLDEVAHGTTVAEWSADGKSLSMCQKWSGYGNGINLHPKGDTSRCWLLGFDELGRITSYTLSSPIQDSVLSQNDWAYVDLPLRSEGIERRYPILGAPMIARWLRKEGATHLTLRRSISGEVRCFVTDAQHAILVEVEPDSVLHGNTWIYDRGSSHTSSQNQNHSEGSLQYKGLLEVKELPNLRDSFPYEPVPFTEGPIRTHQSGCIIYYEYREPHGVVNLGTTMKLTRFQSDPVQGFVRIDYSRNDDNRGMWAPEMTVMPGASHYNHTHVIVGPDGREVWCTDGPYLFRLEYL